MVPKDDLNTQSTILIPEHCQSGFLALLAKFDFAIPCGDKYLFVHCLLPKELGSSTKPMTKASRTSVSNVLIPNISKIYKGISNSFAEMIDGIKEITSKLSEQQDTKTKICLSSAPDSSITEDRLLQDHTRLGDCRQKNNSSSHHKSSVSSHDEDHCAHQFPRFNIVDSASFENSINSSLSSSIDEKQWLKTTDLNPVLHPPLRRIWLASFIPDGFWPQLLAKIILDNAICSTLSTILSTALQNNEYTLNLASPDASSLWRLSQLGLAIEYDKIKLVELMQTTNVCNNSDKYNLSEQYTYQIELTIHIRDIVLVHKQEASQDSNSNVIRLATRVLVLIEQHILDIGKEWFPGTISDSRNKQTLSFVPCPLCISRNDDNTSYTDCVGGHWFLHCGGCKVVCFSFNDLLVAYALPPRSANCPLHKDMLVQQLAPDMVSTYYKYQNICSCGLYS